MRELFIYYRSPAERSAEVAGRVRAFQARLVALHPQLTARLLRRPGQRDDGAVTWMETYAIHTMSPSDGVDRTLESEIEAAAESLRGCIDGTRHIEVFEPCAW